MKYGIVSNLRSVTKKRHYGVVQTKVRDNIVDEIKIHIMNKRNSHQLRNRNKKLFQELLKLINKYYVLEDFQVIPSWGNKSSREGSFCRKRGRYIEKGSLLKTK